MTGRNARRWPRCLAGTVLVASFGAFLTTVTMTSAAATTTVPVTRIFGTDAIGTSIAVSQAGFQAGGSANAVVLARSDFFADALAGGPLAVQVGGPLLITPGASLSSTLDPRVQAEIQRVLPAGKTVYILGGTLALSPNIDSALQALGYVTQRIAGANEYATAVDIAQALGNPTTVFEATGLTFQDALSSVPAAIKEHGAILLTDGSSQAPETAAYLAQHGGDTRYAIGGSFAAAGADPTATEVAGQDLYGTSADVASTFFPSASVFGAATGADYPDALSGGVFVGLPGTEGPMLLVDPSGPLPPTIDSYLSGDLGNLTRGYLFGGSLAVGDDVLAELEHPQLPPLLVATSALPGGTVGVPYAESLLASGGTAPYVWTITAGSLPPGLALSPSGAITGTPSGAGSFNFTVQVVDATAPMPFMATQPLSILVSAPAAPSCTATMSNSTPADYTDDTVNITSNVPDEPVLITKYYRTTTSTDTGETDSGGAAAITFNDSGATLGYTVMVDVNINNGEATCSTSFTPE